MTRRYGHAAPHMRSSFLEVPSPAPESTTTETTTEESTPGPTPAPTFLGYMGDAANFTPNHNVTFQTHKTWYQGANKGKWNIHDTTTPPPLKASVPYFQQRTSLGAQAQTFHFANRSFHNLTTPPPLYMIPP